MQQTSIKADNQQPPAEARSIQGQEGLGVILTILSAFGFGIMGIFGTWAYVNGSTVNTLLVFRFGIAAALFWPYILLTGQQFRLKRGQVGSFAILGVMYSAQAFCYFTAIQYVDVGIALIILYTYPALVTLLSRLIYKEPLTALKLAALALAVAGCVLIVLTPVGPQKNLWLGVALSLTNAVIYSSYIIYSTRAVAGQSAVVSSAYIFGVAAAVLLLVGGFSGEFRPLLVVGWGWLAILGVSLFGTVLAIAAFFAGLARLGPSRASIISTFEPLVGAVAGFVLLGQQIAGLQLVGGGLVVGAVILLQLGSRSAPLPPPDLPVKEEQLG